MTPSSQDLVFDRGGSGAPLLVLIHGLGANGRVWQPMLALAAQRWAGRWIAPDLRGHGGSAAGASYGIEDHAADIAALIAAEQSGAASGDAPVTLLGHSLGGVVALALAGGGFGVDPVAAFGLGIKVAWTDEELQRLAAMAERPSRTHDTAEEARAFYGRLSGLGTLADEAPMAVRSVMAGPDGWRAAVDMRAFAVTRPPMARLLAEARCPVRLACGDGDAMVTLAQLQALDAGAVTIAGAGHNAMVDAPLAVWSWLEGR